MIKCRIAIYVSILLSLVGCGSTQETATYQTVEVTNVPYLAHFRSAKHLKIDISLGNEPKDIYLLVTNHSKNRKNIKLLHRDSKMTIDDTFDTNTLAEKNHQKSLRHVPIFVDTFRKKIPILLRQKKSNTTKRNPSQSDSNAASKVSASIRYSRRIATAFGYKTLKIWVSNESFGQGCIKAKCVTQNMVNILGKSFLSAGKDNDIYDWVTNIYGEEWGPHQKNGLIGERNDITIFLTDIDRDNSTHGGVVGYFYAKNNFLSSQLPGSNERLMFYIDSVLFANGTGGWDIDDFWPKEILSTLAHEFTHMIHFYQKTVLRTEVNTDTWIEEMLAESTEDLLASKIHYSGARGVDYHRGDAGESGNTRGRYPRFNANNRVSLSRWDNRLLDYAKVNAFGAYLLRNYGGAKILHDIMLNNYTDVEAITSVTHENLPKLLRQWGEAILLSDEDNLVDLPTYNRGDYIPNSYHDSVYQLGSINFFNYNPAPLLLFSKSVEPEANLYTKIAEGVVGSYRVELDLEKDLESTLIIKKSRNVE